LAAGQCRKLGDQNWSFSLHALLSTFTQLKEKG